MPEAHSASARSWSRLSVRAILRSSGTDLALALWASGIHEARLLAGMVADPRQVTDEQMESWVAELDSWDVCDQTCLNAFAKSPLAWKKVQAWAPHKDAFVRRAAFALLACLAVNDKQADDSAFIAALPLLEAAAGDDRNNYGVVYRSSLAITTSGTYTFSSTSDDVHGSSSAIQAVPWSSTWTMTFTSPQRPEAAPSR